MSGKAKNDQAMKLEKQAKKRAKQKRKDIIKAALAILLALLMVGIAIAPAFSETLPQQYGVNDLIKEDNYLLEKMTSSLDSMLISDSMLSAAATGSDASSDISPVSRMDFSEVNVDMEKMIEYIEQNYYKDVDAETLIEGAYKGMLDVLDQHSTYFSQDEYDDFITGLSGEFTGVGASISAGPEGYIQVVAPLKDSPAEKAGLKAGDLIVTVDGASTADWTTEKAVSVIRGEAGTPVTLGVKREGADGTLDIVIVRGVIVLSTVSYEMLTDQIGYIEITQFGENTNDEFDEAMATLMNNDVHKLIVDVRNNPGGYLNAAIHVSDYFVEKGKIIVKEELSGGRTQVFRANREKVPAEVVVLVNEGSASASEIFAGSLQQTGGGTVIGTNTYGKGTVQTPYDMAYAGAIKLTIAEYVLNNDYHVDGVGIIPDVMVALPTEADYQAYLQYVPMNETKAKHHGDISLNVYGAQQRLNLLGESLTVDGKLGYNTEAALKRFQEAHNLKANGVLTIETAEAIKLAADSLFDGKRDQQLEAALSYLQQ
ncbi:MAG: carboxyl-terminal processing protease [Clostridiales bacterium]|nr:carboxyl-terminal processing protease [Clostridiales bacterium]